jgi:hypothetical protein
MKIRAINHVGLFAHLALGAGIKVDTLNVINVVVDMILLEK